MLVACLLRVPRVDCIMFHQDVSVSLRFIGQTFPRAPSFGEGAFFPVWECTLPRFICSGRFRKGWWFIPVGVFTLWTAPTSADHVARGEALKLISEEAA